MSVSGDGSAANPYVWVDDQPIPESVRDKFAMTALPGVIREMWGDECLLGDCPAMDMANAACQIADAMIEARKEKQ